MMTLNDLCVPIAKIRMVAEFMDIDRHGDQDNDFGLVEIDRQALVGVHFSLAESAREIEGTARKEHDRWFEERRQYRQTIDKLNRRITELRGGISHEDNR